MLLLVVGLAAGLRLYRLGEWPPGPYRDEAYNGLDALGVLRGDLALFFPANNGREPLFIYLVALSLALFGPTTFALRLPAALVGALATLPVYWLGRDWFGRAAGLFAAILWAVTFWPVHLGRIGLRAGLTLPDLLALNNLSESAIINPGDALIVGFVAPLTATPVITPTAPLPPPTPQPTATPATATICLSAFDDLNRDGVHDPGEPLRAGVAFTIYNTCLLYTSRCV